MKFRIVVDVELERDEGKFASKEEMIQQVIEAIESADEGSWYGENDGVYSTVDFDVKEA